MSNFTKEQLAAITHYMEFRSKVKAYEHAYPTGGLPRSTVRVYASRLFRLEHVAFAVRQIEADDLRKMKVDGSWVLRRAALLANFNINIFVEVGEDGRPFYDFSAATDDDWYCISELTVDQIVKGTGDDTYEVEKVKLKSIDKLKALDLVGKHVEVQAFQENHQHTVLDTEGYKKARMQMLAEDDC